MANLSQDTVIKRFIDKHGDTYDYSKVVYVKAHHKVEVICKKHGSFWVQAQNHWNGSTCPNCANEHRNDTRKLTLKAFLDKAYKTHKTRYDYSKVQFQNSRDKITIICKEHGEFCQIIHDHLGGSNCPKCASCNRRTLWSDTQWEEAGEKSKGFEGYSVYILKCTSEKETFYKIGKTFQNINKRFKYSREMPYEWVLLYQVYGSAKTISDLERLLHTENKTNAYIPIIEFPGNTECFSELPNKLKEQIND